MAIKHLAALVASCVITFAIAVYASYAAYVLAPYVNIAAPFYIAVLVIIILMPIFIGIGVYLLWLDDDETKRLDAYLSKLDFADSEVRRVFAPYVVKYQKHEI